MILLKRYRIEKALMICMVVISIWGVCGCAVVTTAEQGVDDNGDPRVEYKERSFRSKLSVVNIKQRDVGGLLQASATLRNKWGMSLRFQYQFRFFDKDGFLISKEGRPWTAILIAGGDKVDVTAVSPNPSAQSFTVIIQRELIHAY